MTQVTSTQSYCPYIWEPSKSDRTYSTVVAVVAVVFTLFTALAALGFYTQITGIVAGLVGTTGLLLGVSWISTNCTKVQEEQRLQDVTPLSRQASTRSKSWPQANLKTASKTSSSQSLDSLDLALSVPFKAYNLDPTGKPIFSGFAINDSMFPFPTIGQYATYDESINRKPELVVRLSQKHLSKFPKAIQEKLSKIPERNIDVYFFIYAQRSYNRGSTHNLLFHPWIMPGYDSTIHNNEIVQIEVGLFEAQGIYPFSTEFDDPNALDFGKFKSFNQHLHEPGLHFSPDNCLFKMGSAKESTASFYAAARAEKKGIAFFTILLFDSNRDVQTAINQPSWPQTLDALTACGQAFSPAVSKIFY